MASVEPVLGANPPSGAPPSGRVARLRVRLAVLRGRGRIVAGPGVTAARGVTWDVARGARVVLGAGCAIGERTRVHVTGGELRLGAGTVLGDRCVLRIAAGARLGDGCRLADEVVLLDTAPEVGDVDVPVRVQGTRAEAIVIGDRVRIGSRTVVQGGARVGAGAQIAAWLAVDGEVPAGARWEGAPAPGRAGDASAQAPRRVDT
jgi:acetyltransferase-like isoleucine patch superfamily enzyme